MKPREETQDPDIYVYRKCEELSYRVSIEFMLCWLFIYVIEEIFRREVHSTQNYLFAVVMSITEFSFWTSVYRDRRSWAVVQDS